MIVMRNETGAGTFDSLEFYLLWLIVAATYGVGDVLTTMALVDTPGLREANAVVAASLTFGGGGLVALKLVAIGGCAAVSVWAALRRDRVLYYFPPFLLSVLGIVVTVHNLGLLLG